MQTQEMLAPCGIDCSQCGIFIAARDRQAARRLAEAWRANGFANAEPEWFRCQGCRGDRSVCWSEDCRVFRCCVAEKGHAFCSDCAEFPCSPLQEWGAKPEHHRQALERLRAMRASV